MKRIKLLLCMLIIGALLTPYTAFAEYDDAEYGYGEGVLADAFASSEGTFSLSAASSNPDEPVSLTNTDIEMLKYIISEIPKLENSIPLPEEYQMPADRFVKIYQQYMGYFIQYEHPEIFYLANSFGYSYSNISGNVTALNPKYTAEYTARDGVNAEAILAAQNAIDAEVDSIIAGTTGMTDLEKALYVHDYIAANYTYDTRVYDSNPDVDGNRTLDKMVKEKTGVCQGYSYLYMTVMNKLGIECVLVPTDELQHVWNKVKLNGEWYNVDVTYDDPISSRIKNISHKYFLVNDEKIKELDPSNVSTKLYLLENNVFYAFEDPHIYQGSDTSHFIVTDGDDVIIDNGYAYYDAHGRTFITDGQAIVMYERKETSCHITWNKTKWDGSAIEVSAGTRYSQSPLHYVTGPTAYIDGKFFCTCGDSYPYYTNNEIYEIIFEDSVEVLRVRQQELDNIRWYVYGQHRYYYTNPYDPDKTLPYYSSSMVTYNGKVYVNSPSAVYEFNPSTYELTEVYKYTEIPDVSETYLYGLRVVDGALYAEYTTDAAVDNVALIPVTITEPEKPEEPEPEPEPEVFPVFEEMPCEKPTVEVLPTTVTDEETGEETTNYEVTVSVEIPDEVKTVTEEAKKPVMVSVAKYDDSGCFMGFETVEANENSVTFTADDECSMIKAFIWAGFIMPLSDVGVYDLKQEN